jgi:two-component system NtrC family sensor kinase
MSSHDPIIEALAAGVAHEVRNPLNSLQINVRILEQELAELLPDPTAHPFTVLGKLSAEIKRLDDFVSEFLRFARPPRLNPERLAIRPLLGDLTTFMAPECSKKGVRLSLASGDRGLTALVDGFQIKQAVLNLVLNALQATPSGGEIVIRAVAAGESLRIAVEDDGEGIPDDQRDKVFTVFFTTREGGTGLGLPLVQRIVEQHGGRVELASRPQGGTTATIVLPLKPER